MLNHFVFCFTHTIPLANVMPMPMPVSYSTYVYTQSVQQQPPNLYHSTQSWCICLIGHIIRYNVA